MWAGPLHDQEFVKQLRKTVDSLDENVYKTRTRMVGMLTLAGEVGSLIFIIHVRNWTPHSFGPHMNSQEH
jgi:tRNA G26 N,N-dimethylase Trm1